MAEKKKKGVSAAEKRERLLTMFRESKEVYTMAEVEKEGPKTGVVRSAVMDVNQALIDDGLVESEKIGSTLYCWSFPSKHVQQVGVQSIELTENLQSETAALGDTKLKLEAAKSCREESEARDAKLRLLSSLKRTISELEGELEGLREVDPVEIARQAEVTETCKKSANRWTDNIHEVRSWLVKKRNMSTKEASSLMKQLGCSSEVDYLE